jgi:hypothetical protein
LILAPSVVKAEKYVIFISGYGGNYWTNSGLPDEWKSLVPTGNVLILDDALVDLPNEIQGAYYDILAGRENARTWFTDFLKRSLRTKMINLFGGDSDVEVILVGHSLGGYAARFLEDTINQFQFPSPIQNVKVIGVLTVATPHQGLRVTELSVGARTGFKNVEAPINEFKDKVRAPLYPVYDNGWISWAVNNFAGSATIQTLNDLPNIIEESYDELIKQPFVGVSIDVPGFANLELYAQGFFKENGIIPNLNNGISSNTPQRSVFGVEKASTVVRAADEVLGNGQEKETVDNVSSLRRYYKAQEDAWWIEHEIEYYSTRHYIGAARRRANARKDEYKRRSRLWRDGRYAIEGIDRTWTDAIDAKRLETYTYTVEVYVGCDNDTRISFPSNFPEPVGGPGCLDDGWVTETRQSSSIVPQKNDAVSIPHFYTLKKADMDRYASTTQSGNFFYSDTEARGGYNHMEIRRLRRAYNDSGNGIVKGEKARPMREAEDWIIVQLNK